MKRGNTLGRLTAWIALALAPTYGPAAEGNAAQITGAIAGHVQNIATGQYLGNARVSVKGTNLVAFTDAFGVYRIINVPSGPAVLQVFFTDLDPLEIPLIVPVGQSINQNVGLSSANRYGQDPNMIKMSAFRVSTQRETDAEAIATNEQRFAPNIKNVLSTDALGDVFGNSAGDFLKHIPGLTVDYDNADVSTVSVRGMGAAMTGVTFDGAPIVTGSNSGPTRQVEMRTQALNNISRIEVTKVPTPSSPADSLGGSVNMISKSAFERKGRELRYGLNLSGNSHALDLKKTPEHYGDQNTMKIHPGFDFDLTLPSGQNFGIVVTGMQSTKYREQNKSLGTWSTGGTATGASFSRPFLQQFRLQDSPRTTSVTVFSLRADWKVTPNSVLTLGGRWGRNIRAKTGTTLFTPTVGTIGTPTVASGTPFSYGPEFTIGATGRGGVTLSNTKQYSQDDTFGTNLTYRYDNGKWRIESSLNHSGSDARLLSDTRGNFNNVTTVLIMPARVTFTGITSDHPASIQVFDNNNRAIDIYDLSNYRIANANIDNRTHILSSKNGTLDILRRLTVFPFPTSIKAGGLRRIQTVDASRRPGTWNYTGASNNPNSFSYTTYVYDKNGYGFRNVPNVSPETAWKAYQADSSLFTQTLAQQVAAEAGRLNTSEYAEETVSALYLQGEARLLKNRLTVLTGVRFERTDVAGQGLLFDLAAAFVRNADGSFARNALGSRVRKSEAGAAGSLAELRLIRQERAFVANRSYDGYYPSLHLTYSIRENFLVRAAYAKTYGRPDFSEIIPNADVQEADLDGANFDDPAVTRGNIVIRNTGLRPWAADNYDLSLEYYTQQGGLFSAGVFRKEITDFFGDDVRVATSADVESLGIDSRYIGWNLSTKFNSGNARISGFELSLRHSLRPLGAWGKHFVIFTNATRLYLEGDRQASFESFIPKTGNMGFSFNWKRLTVSPKLNYRGLNKLIAQPQAGPDGFQYLKERYILDLSFSYQLTRRLALTGALNNVLNNHLTEMIYGSQTPLYARKGLDSEYGVAISIGIRGSF